MPKPNVDSALMAEAQKYVTNAEKKLQTSIFQWTPHYFEGGKLYQKAAELFARNRLRPHACNAWRKASEAYEKANANVEAASCLSKLALFLTKNYESDLVSSKLGEVTETLQEVISAYDKSSLLFRAERPTLSIDVLHSLVDVIHGLLSKDLLVREPLIGPSVPLPCSPLYNMHVSVTLLLLCVYHALHDAGEIYPHRVPSLCRTAVSIHLRCRNLGPAIAIEKHLLGEVHPLVLETTKRYGAGVVLENIISALQDLPSNGIEKKGNDKIPVSSISVGRDAKGSQVAWQEPDSFDVKYNVFKRLQQPFTAARTGLEIIILTVQEDFPVTVRANTTYSKLSGLYGFQGSPEKSFAALLLSALEENNVKRLEEVLKDSSCLAFIMAPISRMAMNFLLQLPPPIEASKTPKSSSMHNDSRGDTVREDHGVPHLKSATSAPSTSLFKNAVKSGKEIEVPTSTPEKHIDVNSSNTSFPITPHTLAQNHASDIDCGRKGTLNSETRRNLAVESGVRKLSFQPPNSQADESSIECSEPSITVGDTSPPYVPHSRGGSAFSRPSSYRVSSADPHYLNAQEDPIMTPPPPPQEYTPDSSLFMFNKSPFELGALLGGRTNNNISLDTEKKRKERREENLEGEVKTAPPPFNSENEENAEVSPQSLYRPVDDDIPLSTGSFSPIVIDSSPFGKKKSNEEDLGINDDFELSIL